MNANDFFEKYSIEEISKRTKISPITLRLIRNKEFKKIPKVKFFGFLKIIENEFNVDLSDLKQEYEENKPVEKEIKEIKIEKNNQNNYVLIFLSLILLILGVYLLYKSIKTSKNNHLTPKNTYNISLNASKETNTSNLTYNKKEYNQTIDTIEELNTTKNVKEKNETNKTITYPVIIAPNKLLWFRAVNIDTNKTFEYLTTHKKILPKGNYYIKLGHGDVNISYNNQLITPHTKKVTRILLQNGKYKYLTKPNRFEK